MSNKFEIRKLKQEEYKSAQRLLNSEVGLWEYKHTPTPEPKEPIPGIDIPPVDKEFEEKVSRNSWHDREELQTVVDKILQLSNKAPYENDGNTLKDGCSNWSWSRNWNCKYIDIRVDMRDGGFILTNNEGERINLDYLQWQYKFKE